MENFSKYLPTEEMRAEFEQYKALTTEEERAAFQEKRANRVADMPETEREKYISASMKGLDATIETAENLLAVHKLGAISEAISLSYIAKTYFGKSKEWLYQRLNGYKVNGKPAQFTPQEQKQFANALADIGTKLEKTSLNFR
ncbi:MAG: DUF5053 domain-containing protein [Bacteroidia bacterium]|nr:DUF5053 domain-containing protein [Bacteroidia bacterium]